MAQISTSLFHRHADQLRREVDSALGRSVELGDGCPTQLLDAIRHSLLAPAKRLRPLLVLMAAEACGCDRERAMPAACAVELVHTYSLVHDDLPAMDDDDMRRGRPSCHAMFGEATAILAGDALLALAFEHLAAGIEPTSLAARCCQRLAQAAGATALVGGQMDDLNSTNSSAGISTLESIHHRKTGALIRVSLQLGGLIAGADTEQMSALDAYGNGLGMAFQITDDLLDTGGDPAVLGKPVGRDQDRGKLTYPGLLGDETSRQRAEELIDQACAELVPLGENTGGLEALARYVLERNR